MKLPLYIHHDYCQDTLVCDAEHLVICRLKAPEGMTIARAIVRKMNRSWRYRLLGQQPYEYTREDWLFEKNKC